MPEKDNEFDFADISKNPYIPKPDDYFEGYNKSIEENFNNEAFKYSQLTHNLFMSTAGRQWMAETKLHLSDRFIDLGSYNSALELAELQGTRRMLNTIEQHIAVFEQHLQGK